MSRKQNHFFLELVNALRFELDRIGVHSYITTDGFPPAAPEQVCVLFPPHEYFALERSVPSREVLARTIFVCAEQPKTGHFDQNVELAPAAGAVFDINQASVREFSGRGVKVGHLPLGYSAYWEDPATGGERDVDLVFLGCETPRRARYLASLSPILDRHRSRLIITDNSSPNPTSLPNFLVGGEKLALLRRSKVLINIHQDRMPYFEWQRVVECVHSGCVVVSEHSTDYDPFVAGRHFVSGRPEVLGHLAEELLDDPAARESMRQAALDCLRMDRPLRNSAVRLVEAAIEIAARPSRLGRRWKPPAWTKPPRVPPPAAGGEPSPGRTPSEASAVRAMLKDLRLDLLDVRRQLARHEIALSGGDASAQIVRAWASPAFRRGSEPRVTVVTALYNHADWIVEALQSVADGDLADLECIVVDDGSTDGSAKEVERWSRRNPDLPLLLLRHPVNRGLPRARNAAVDFARGEFAFILDADNRVFPSGIKRLVEAIDSDPEASFAYGMLACFDESGYQRLISEFPWEPARLRYGNYIDAMALLRVNALRQLGGYTTDRRLYGWEDYDLYCRLAERGEHAVFVPEVVAAYRVSPTSMLSLTNISWSAAFAAVREHCPTLMQGMSEPEERLVPGARLAARLEGIMERVLS